MTTKISISDLEAVRRSPNDFANRLAANEGGGIPFSGQPKSMRWLSAVCDYHDTGSITHASDFLEQAFRNRRDTRKNRLEVEQFISSLGAYEIALQVHGLVRLRSREKVEIRLGTNDIVIGGWIHLIMMKAATGFAGFFVGRHQPDWENQLKYPLTQWYIAETLFRTDSQNVSVGLIDFTTGAFHSTTYTEVHIAGSLQEITDLVDAVASHLSSIETL